MNSWLLQAWRRSSWTFKEGQCIILEITILKIAHLEKTATRSNPTQPVALGPECIASAPIVSKAWMFKAH